MNSLLAGVLLCLGLLALLAGCLGALRLGDFYARLQAATKGVTLGTLLVLVSAALYVGWGPVAMKCLICAAFVLIAVPVAAQALARGAHRSGVRLTGTGTTDHLEQDHPTPSASGNE